VDNLPVNLRDLILGAAFNRPTDHLPTKLENIRFDSSGAQHSEFNKPLDNLPTNLQSITFIDFSVFDQPLDHFPESLHSLILYKLSPTETSVAASMQYMSTSYTKNTRHMGRPTKMKTCFNRYLCHLPARLKVLQIRDCFNKVLMHLPTTLEIVTLYCHKYVKVAALFCHTRICK